MIDPPFSVCAFGTDAPTVGSPYGGPGELSMWRLLRGELAFGADVNYWVVPPGAGEGVHTHGGDAPLEELYVVVEGALRIVVDDTEIEAPAGSAVRIPAGVPHGFVNRGSAAARLLLVFGPPRAGC